VAAVAAPNGPQDCVEAVRTLYREGRDFLIKALVSAGWEMPCAQGSMFGWASVPARFASLGSLELFKLLLEGAKVAISPGIGLGEHGDRRVRIALVENMQRLRQALRSIRGFLRTGSDVAPAPASVADEPPIVGAETVSVGGSSAG
jgi:alanine-synthesizing transaminase